MAQAKKGKAQEEGKSNVNLIAAEAVASSLLNEKVLRLWKSGSPGKEKRREGLKGGRVPGRNRSTLTLGETWEA